MKAILLSLALAPLMVGCGEPESEFERTKSGESEFERTKRLAEGGDKVAQYDLGLMYEYKLKGVPLDYKEAVKWYTKAAAQGDADAQCNLGLMYYIGKGVPEDLVHAYAWLIVAQANGQEDAKELRDELELTPEQVAKAQALSTEIQKRIEANKKD